MKKTAMLLCASGLFLMSASHAATLENKYYLCHSDGETWTKIVVLESEASEHFALHDDTFPGWSTSLSGTKLDRDCKPVASLNETAE